jgi:hypothetical protein
MQIEIDKTSGFNIIIQPQMKACPFCGSNKIELINDDGYRVGCTKCATYVAPYLGPDSDSKEKVIEYWNGWGKAKETCQVNFINREKHKYNDKILMQIIGSYDNIASLSTIINKIHLCGCGGHSFSIYADEVNGKKIYIGGFDGDGTDYISLQLMIKEKNHEYVYEFGKNNTYSLYVEGSRCGINSIRDVLKQIRTLRQACDKRIIISGEKSDGVFGTYGHDWNDNKDFNFIISVMEATLNISAFDFSEAKFFRQNAG